MHRRYRWGESYILLAIDGECDGGSVDGGRSSGKNANCIGGSRSHEVSLGITGEDEAPAVERTRTTSGTRAEICLWFRRLPGSLLLGIQILRLFGLMAYIRIGAALSRIPKGDRSGNRRD